MQRPAGQPAVDFGRAISTLFEQVWSAALGEPLRSADDAHVAVSHASDDERFCVSIRGDWSGLVVLSCPHRTASEFASSLLGKAPSELSHGEVEATLFELVNIFGGNLKSVLPGRNDLALPTRAPLELPLDAARMLHLERLAFRGWPLCLQVFSAPR
jgi:chemotaxis protein CheX